MRAVVASAMILVLVSVVALCPALACPLTAASHAPSGSCCHKPPTHPAPCPHSILEKGKTNPAATHAKWVGSIAQMEHNAILPVAGLTVTAPCRLVDTSGLFLRNGVLLI
jgi:hypothetical protein